MSATSKSRRRYSTFSPQDIGGLALWLDASDTTSITLSGSNVATWADKSGNGRHGTGAGTVTYNTSAINNKPAVSFTAVTNSYIRGAYTNTGTTLSAYVVATLNSGATNNSRILSIGAVGAADWNTALYAAPFIRTSGLSFYSYRGGSGTNQIAIPAYNTPFVMGCVYDGTNKFLLINGTPTFNGSTGSFGPSNYQIGTSFGEEGSLNYYGFIGEVIIYNAGLTVAQRQQVEGYLASKWGASSALTYPSKVSRTVTREFQPLDISNCNLWMDAADSSSYTLSGTSISQWRDKSGNKNSITGGTYNAIGTLGNSLPTMSLSGDGNAIVTANVIGISGATPQSMVVVAKHNSDSSDGMNIIHYLTAGGGNAFTNSIGITVGNTVVTSFQFQVGNTIRMTGLSPSKTKMAIMVHDGTTGSIFESGTAGDTTTYTPNQTDGTIRIYTPTGTLELGELIIYSKGLSTFERQKIESYLAIKWGLQANLPSVHNIKLYRPLSPIFLPTYISSCSFWYDMSDYTTITYAGGSSVNVTAVKDKTSNAINLSRVTYTAGYEITTANKLNGLTTLTFPGDPADNNATLTYLTTTVSVPMTSNANYIFFVMRFNPYVLQGTSTARSWGILYPFSIYANYGLQGGIRRSAGSWYLNYGAAFVGDNANGSEVISNRSNGPETGTPFIGMFGKTGASQYVFSYNGNYETKAGQSYVMVGGQPMHVGIFYQAQELCEIIYYQGSILTLQDISRVEGYLAWKWGLVGNLPSSHPYKKFPPS